MPLLHNRLSRLGLLLLAASVGLSGCQSLGAGFRAKRDAGALRENTRPVELVYNAGAQLVDRGEWLDSIDYFSEVERNYPASVWAGRATLMEAYAHYRNAQFDEASLDAERYIREHQGESENGTGYAYYLRAVCAFDQIYDVGRDQAYTTQAMAALLDVTLRFKDSEYARDAKLKIDMVNDQLAGKEMDVGRFYLNDGKDLAAAGRFRDVVDHYNTTSHTPEALYRLVEVYLTLGLADEAKRNGAILGYNYPGDPWYSDAYKLLTDNGLQPTISPANRGQQRNAIQRLFNRGSALPPPSAAAPVVAVAAPATVAAPVAAAAPQRRSLLSRLFGR
ncbi:MAG: outer membrane protein assembly factor BamD [Caulobacteraceae bacterium]|nr:outer membrane protein assembly factor BamD [Caulobacteraceae bacterium]